MLSTGGRQTAEGLYLYLNMDRRQVYALLTSSELRKRRWIILRCYPLLCSYMLLFNMVIVQICNLWLGSLGCRELFRFLKLKMEKQQTIKWKKLMDVLQFLMSKVLVIRLCKQCLVKHLVLCPAKLQHVQNDTSNSWGEDSVSSAEFFIE